MTETPKCPYCGEEMTVMAVRLARHNWIGWCNCENCLSVGPSKSNCYTEKEAKESATSATLHRAEPENRLLTLEEIIEKLEDEEWNVVWMECPEQRVTVPMCPQYREGDTIICCAPLTQCKGKLSNYGKTWRCWPRKPTPEQMAAAEWEE